MIVRSCLIATALLFLVLCGCRAPGTSNPKKQKTATEATKPTSPAPQTRGPAGPGWHPVGFGGAGNFLSVHVDPGDSKVVYAASDVTGVLRSADGGQTWQTRSVGLGNYEVSSFAVDPFDSRVLYAGVGAFRKALKAGVYVSRNAGKSWTHLSATQRHGIVFRKYRTMDAIAPHPKQKGVILAGSAHNGLWRTADAGKSWARVLEAPKTPATLDMEDDQDEPGSAYGAPVAVVRFAPDNAQVVYAGLYGAGVYKSEKGGVARSWSKASVGLPTRATIKSLAVAAGGVLYAAAAKQGVYRSDDAGEHWRKVSGGLPLSHGWVTSVAVHPKKSDVAFLAMASEERPSVWKTENGGKRWSAQKKVEYDQRHNPTRAWAASHTLSWWISLDPRNPERLFFTDYWSIQRSDDGGASWSDRIQGAQNTCVTGLLVHGGQLYASHMDAGLLASDGQGGVWRTVVPRRWVDGIVGHYWRVARGTDGKESYLLTTMSPWVGKEAKVLRSADGGKSWRTVLKVRRTGGVWMDGAMMGLAVDPKTPTTVYVSRDGGKVHVSRDAGKTWRPTSGQPKARSYTYALAVDGKGRVFAGSVHEGLWRSTDKGKSWKRTLRHRTSVWRVVAAGELLYASAGDANLYRSEDGGKRWKRLTTGLTAPHGDEVGNQGMAIAVDPADARHILFSRLDTYHSADGSLGLMESRDGGKSWTSANQGLGMLNVSNLAFGRGGTVYAGTWCGGIWRRGKGKD